MTTAILSVAVPVTDQQRALDFYVRTLGMEVRRDLPYGPSRWIEVAPPGATTTIALAGPGMPLGPRYGSVAIDDEHAALVAAGVDVDASVMRVGDGVPPMFTGRDPDGNTFVVVGTE